jgi:hypothetical protein
VRTVDPIAASRLPLTFGQPGVASMAGRHARAFTAWLVRKRRAPWLSLRDNILLSVVAAPLLFLLGMPLPLALGVPIVVGLQVLFLTIRYRRMLVQGMAEWPGVHEPSTVTIDDAGIHVVGPTVAEHRRWDELGGASIRRGFLVVEDRNRSPIELICLDLLGSSVDERRLLAEVRRRIA